jgi:hypothetical protein
MARFAGDPEDPNMEDLDEEFDLFLEDMSSETEEYINSLGLDARTYFDEYYGSGRDLPDQVETPDSIYDYLNEPDDFSGIDYSQLEEDTRTGTDDSLIFGDVGATGYSVTDDTPDYSSGRTIDKSAEDATDDLVNTTPSGNSRTYPRGPRTTVPGLPNTSVRLGPILTGGAALSISNSDDDETIIPFQPGNDDMTDLTTTDTPTYTLDPMGRLIPSTMATGETPGTLGELDAFFDVYGGADGMGGRFAEQMAGVTGAGQTAYAQQVLGMEGDDISAFDIAKETSSQQRDALANVFGADVGNTYADIVAAGTAPMQGLSQVRQTVLPGLQSAFQTSQERLEQGLTGRERQQVEQATRARFGALGRGTDTAALATEIGDIMQEERGLYSQNLQDLLGIGQTTSNLGQQEAYAMSPFTQAAIGSADLGPGLALAGDIGRQAAAGTPSPTDIFGLEAGERQFSLNQQALQQMAEAGRLDLISQGIGAVASGFRGGPSAGLQGQPTYTTGTYTGQPMPSQFNQYSFPLGGY